ncbi:MAG: CBS domain-containing protein [Planctomycetota bacterium]
MMHPDTPVSAVMTRSLVTVGPDATLAEAASVLCARPFRHLPVLHGGELVGILSDRDLLEASGGREAGGARRVREIMRERVQTANPGTSVAQAGEFLAEEKIGSLVVRAGRRIEGIVTRTDLLRAFREWCRATRGVPWFRALVRDHMTPDPRTIELDAPLAEALRICRELRIRRLPVLREGRVYGILSDRDLRRAIAYALEKGEPAAAVRVAAFASPTAMVIAAASSLTAAVFTLVGNEVGALPVLEATALVGVISQADILRAHAGL